MPQRQTFLTIQPVNTFTTISPASRSQEHTNTSMPVVKCKQVTMIALIHMNSSDESNDTVPVQRTRHIKQRSGIRPIRSASLTQLIGQPRSTRRIQSLLLVHLACMTLLRLRSATDHLSFAIYSLRACAIDAAPRFPPLQIIPLNFRERHATNSEFAPDLLDLESNLTYFSEDTSRSYENVLTPHSAAFIPT